MPLAHITLATRDLRKSEAFFAEALGWRPIRRPGNIDRPAAWLEIAPGQELHLVEVADFEPSPFESEFGRHVALAVSSGEFAALRRRLPEPGAVLIEPQRETPFPRSCFRDPNGYVFEVIEANQAEPSTD